MATARETVRLGLAARGQAKLKVRQPLRAAVVVATGEEREAIERMSAIVREELNVKELRFVSEADELAEVELKPDYRRLGPRFGKHMPLVAAAIAGLDATHAVATLRAGGHVAISVDGKDHELSSRGPAGRDEAARGLPGRARGLPRGRPRARDRRRAARGGLGARDRARGAAGPPGGWPRGHRPDLADAGRRRGVARRRACAPGLHRRGDPCRRRRLRAARRRSGARQDRRPPVVDRRGSRPRRGPARALRPACASGRRRSRSWPAAHCGTGSASGSTSR